MRWPWRRAKPEPIHETIPAFLMGGEHILDVGYAEATSLDGGVNWIMETDFNLTFDGPADRVIFETPMGCFEHDVSDVAGWDGPGQLVFSPSKNVLPIKRCVRMSVEAGARKHHLAAQGDQ